MRKLRSLWRGAFDVREGEHGRTLFMALYFLFVLFALAVGGGILASIILWILIPLESRAPVEVEGVSSGSEEEETGS